MMQKIIMVAVIVALMAVINAVFNAATRHNEYSKVSSANDEAIRQAASFAVQVQMYQSVGLYP